MLVTEEQPSHL